MENNKREVSIAFTLDTFGTAVKRAETYPAQAMQNAKPIGDVTFLVGVELDGEGRIVPLDSFEVPAGEATSEETVGKLKKMVKAVTKKKVADSEKKVLMLGAYFQEAPE